MPKFSFTLNRRILGLKPPSKRDFSAKTSRITRMSTSRETLYFLNFSRMSCEVAMSWNRPIAGLWWQQSIWMPRQPCRSRRKLVLADLPLPAGNSTYCLLPTRTCLRMCSRMMSSTPGALASFGVTGRCFHHSGDGMNAMVVDVVVVVVVVLVLVGRNGLAARAQRLPTTGIINRPSTAERMMTGGVHARALMRSAVSAWRRLYSPVSSSFISSSALRRTFHHQGQGKPPTPAVS
mmetsp:Transcript_32508/g.101400  ORF Transcript_32508/g.101400 Transcript_32508/m.101400 type:complete len:235 (+) Transcript_32508:1230-1934(+)